MKSSSLRHFDKLANPVDPSVTAILRAFDAVARSQGHDYLLVGATARHLLLVNALGLKVTRATRDVDFGIAVESWERFEEFKEALIQANVSLSSQICRTDCSTGTPWATGKCPLNLSRLAE